MEKFLKICLLSVVMMSFSLMGFAQDVKDVKDVKDVNKEVCPQGQVFDKDKGVCVVKEAVPAAEGVKTTEAPK